MLNEGIKYNFGRLPIIVTNHNNCNKVWPIQHRYKIVKIDKSQKILSGIDESNQNVKLNYDFIINQHTELPEIFKQSRKNKQNYFITTKDGFLQCTGWNF